MKKILLGTLFGLILYLCSMIDGRFIYDPDKIVDCRLANHSFYIGQKDCLIGQAEFSFRKTFNVWEH